MKKILSWTLLMSIAMMMFAACTKNSSSEKYLSGTKWIGSYKGANYNQVIEFSNDNNFLCYNTNNQGVIIGNVHYGTYSYKDKFVKFTRSTLGFKYAPVKNNIMTLVFENGESIVLLKQ